MSDYRRWCDYCGNLLGFGSWHKEGCQHELIHQLKLDIEDLQRANKKLRAQITETQFAFTEATNPSPDSWRIELVVHGTHKRHDPLTLLRTFYVDFGAAAPSGVMWAGRGFRNIYQRATSRQAIYLEESQWPTILEAPKEA